MNLRQRPRLPLPPGLDPRRVETVDRAVLCLEIVGLALADEGGAVSTYEVSRRREVLRDLDRAARRALVVPARALANLVPYSSLRSSTALRSLGHE